MIRKHPVQINATLTKEEAAKLRSLGGSAWVRVQLNLAAFAGERAPPTRMARIYVNARQAAAWRALGMGKWLRQKLRDAT